MLRWIPLFVSVVFASAAHAQVPAHFVGVWSLTWENLGKYGNVQVSARLEVPETGEGKFLGFGRSKSNNCSSNEAPVAIKVVSDDVIVLTAKLSEVLAGCADQGFRMKRAEDGSVQGFMKKGDQPAPITIKRDS